MGGGIRGKYKLLLLGVICALLLQVQPVEADQQFHRVRPGETLFTIAQKYGIKLESLLLANKFIRFPDELVSNLLLVIPEDEMASNDKSVADVTEKKEDSAPGAGYVKENGIAAGKRVSGISAQKENASGGTGKKSLQAILEELYQEYKDIVFLSGSSKSNKIALTFDDGPSEVTSNQVMDILQRYNVKGTFFLVGQNVSQYPQVVARMVRDGHVVGGHSWSHIQLQKATTESIVREVADTENAIYRVTGLRPAFVRPPYGSLNREGLEYLQRNGYKVINWSVDSLDWKYPNDSRQVLINVFKDVRGGSIILFHTLPGEDPSEIIATVLPQVICTLKSQGYQFVTVDKLLGIPAYKGSGTI